MGNLKEFLKSEKTELQELYYALVNSTYELKDILTEEELNAKGYVGKADSIKKYLEKIDDINYRCNKTNTKKGFFDKFKNNNNDDMLKKELLQFKKSIQHDIRFAKKCVECQCFNCSKTCSFESCKNCALSEIVKSCNKEDKCIYHGMKNMVLYHEETDCDIDFKVLGRLVYDDSEYLLLMNSINEDDLQLYRYSVETNGTEHFDSLSQEEIDEIWDIFLNMGIGR